MVCVLTLLHRQCIGFRSIFILLFQNSLHETSSGTSTGTDSNASTPSPSHYPGPPLTSASTWSNWPDPPHHPAKPDPTGLPFERPHTISTAYERHARPALTSQTFEPPDPVTIERPNSLTVPPTPSMYAVPTLIEHPDGPRDPVGQSPYAVPCIVPQTKRDSKVLEGPGSRLPPPAPGPKPRMKVVAPPVVPDFNSNQPDQSKKMNGKIDLSQFFPSAPHQLLLAPSVCVDGPYACPCCTVAVFSLCVAYVWFLSLWPV